MTVHIKQCVRMHASPGMASCSVSGQYQTIRNQDLHQSDSGEIHCIIRDLE